MDDFSANFIKMTASIQNNRQYSRKVKAMLLPNREDEAAQHKKDAQEGRPMCSCRICYWARGRS